MDEDEEAAVGDAKLMVVVDKVWEEEVTPVVCRHKCVEPCPVCVYIHM